MRTALLLLTPPLTALAAGELERYLRLLNSQLPVTLQLDPAEPLGDEGYILRSDLAGAAIRAAARGPGQPPRRHGASVVVAPPRPPGSMCTARADA